MNSPGVGSFVCLCFFIPSAEKAEVSDGNSFESFKPTPTYFPNSCSASKFLLHCVRLPAPMIFKIYYLVFQHLTYMFMLLLYAPLNFCTFFFFFFALYAGNIYVLSPPPFLINFCLSSRNCSKDTFLGRLPGLLKVRCPHIFLFSFG